MRDERFELPTTVESGRDSTTELITQVCIQLILLYSACKGEALVRTERLELSRTRHWLLRPAWLPLHHVRKFWCHELDSNQPHTDFQSAALPDELPRQYWYLDTVSNRGPSPCKGDALPLSYPGKFFLKQSTTSGKDIFQLFLRRRSNSSIYCNRSLQLLFVSSIILAGT